jgi:hypothetical protein
MLPGVAMLFHQTVPGPGLSSAACALGSCGRWREDLFAFCRVIVAADGDGARGTRMQRKQLSEYEALLILQTCRVHALHYSKSSGSGNLHMQDAFKLMVQLQMCRVIGSFAAAELMLVGRVALSRGGCACLEVVMLKLLCCSCMVAG